MRTAEKMSTVFYTTFESPVGTLLLAGDSHALRLVNFESSKHAAPPQADWTQDRAPFAEVIRQLRAYFRGELKEFDLPLAPEGTEFQLRVWRDYFLLASRRAHRQSQSRARCGLGEREQSHSDHHSVPSGGRQRRQPDGFWRRTLHEEDASRTRKQTTKFIVER